MAFEKRSCFLQSLESGSTVIDIAHQGREKEKNKGKKGVKLDKTESKLI